MGELSAPQERARGNLPRRWEADLSLGGRAYKTGAALSGGGLGGAT